MSAYGAFDLQALGEQKLAIMLEGREVQEGLVVQEWEQRSLQMQTDQQLARTKDVQKLHLSKDEQEVPSHGHLHLSHIGICIVLYYTYRLFYVY